PDRAHRGARARRHPRPGEGALLPDPGARDAGRRPGPLRRQPEGRLEARLEDLSTEERMHGSGAIAEVIESSTRHVVAEVLREAEPPEFGTWVEIPLEGGTTLFGLVAHTEVGSIEPGRRAMALAMDRATLRRDVPQVLALIRTTFRAQILAFRDARGTLHQTLPPRPAALHDMAYPCADEAVCALAAPFDYLRTLVRNPEPAVPTDDLLVAVLRQTYRA